MENELITTQVCECNLHHEANHWLFNQWGYSTLLLVIILIGLAYLLFKKRKFLVEHLKWIAGIVFLIGFGIYWWGFNEGGSYNNWVALTFRSALSSMEMFASHSDLLEIPKELHHDPLYMTVFSIVHFFAVIVSAIFIIKLLGFRFVSWVRLFIINYFDKDNRIFVFWGVNDNSITLANSIIEKAKKTQARATHQDEEDEKTSASEKLKNCKFIFVKMRSSDDKSSHGRFTFSHFFNSSQDGVDNFIEKIENIDGILVNSKLSITGNILGKINSELDLYKCLGLKILGMIIKNHPHATFYFLSQNEGMNIEAVSVFKEIAKSKETGIHDQVQIYCHARKNNQNMKLEICDGLKYQVHIIDSSHLAVLQLKKDPRNHPVNFVNPNTLEACAGKPFTSMIIGFGETGRDAFRFLYEFSAFVDGNGRKNPQKIYVVDQHIDKLKGDFLMQAPALKDRGEVEWCKKMNTHSIDFWNTLSEIINDLNYVVIAIGNDNEGISLAIDLYEYVYRYRKDGFQDFKIYLRINGSRDNIQLNQIKEYFNKLDQESNVIITFGAQEEIFSYDVISTDVLETMAKEFYYAYYGITTAIEKNEEYKKKLLKNYKDNAEKQWRERREPTLESGEKPVQEDLALHIGLSYQEEQDKANAWHIYTKKILCGAINKDGTKNEDRLKEMLKITQREEETGHYPNASEGIAKLLFDNLSKCEHLRWNASMELQGFVSCQNGKSFQRKEHKCIVDCDVLAEKYAYTILYDNCVVELSFRLNIN